MELITPGIGLVFWTTIVFVILFVLLAKFAWKPILGAIKEREQSIENALAAAENAKAEMAKLKSDNERILLEARNERDALLKDARETKEKLIAEAKSIAASEGEKMLAAARTNIQNEKLAAIAELKNQVAVLSIEIAEKILKSELSSDEKQKSLVNNMLKDVNLN
jgi:F-type H+-transporting ATPase subunit b